MPIRLMYVAALVAALSFTSSVAAQTVDFDVLVDTDRNAASGCSITPTGGPTLTGFEQRLRASVDLASFQVTALDQSSCGGGSFGTPFPISGFSTPYPLALNAGIGGADAVELAVARAALGANNLSLLRLAFVTDNGTGSDVLATADGVAGGGPIILGLPVQIPALSIWGLGTLVVVLLGLAWLAHRRMGRVGAVMAVMLVSTAAWAMTFALDGDLTDWGGRAPNATDPGGDATDGSAAIDLVAGFAVLDGADLFFRMDVVDTENQAPVAVDDAFDTNEDTALNIAAPGVLTNDSDPELDPITAVLDAGPANAQSFNLNADGSFDYTPDADFNGSDSFTYFANDGQVDSAPATVTITVNPVDDPPVALAGTASTDEDTPVTITLTGSDVDGDPLTFAIATGPSNGGLGAITPIDASSAEVVYTPDADFNGGDSFTFTVNDGTTTSPAAGIAVTISPVNDPPVANAQLVNAVEDTPITITLTGSDIDGDGLSFSISAAPANGGLGAITPIDATSAEVVYTPTTGFVGSDSFSFTVNDGSVDSPSAAVDVDVAPGNEIPVANPQATGTNEDTAVVVTLTGSDGDSDPLTFAIAAGPTSGSLGAITPLGPTSAQVTYTPGLDFNGADSFDFTADDGSDTSPAATVSITVDPVNDAPSFTAGADVTVLEDSGAFDQPWATGISAGTANESGQVLTFNITANDNPGLFAAGPAIDAGTGNLGFTPATDAAGVANITLELMDDGGTANGGVDTSASVNLSITVTGVNDAPIFAGGPDQTVDEDSGAQTVNAWATGISAGPSDEAGQTLTFNVTGNTDPSLFSAGPAVDSTTGNLSFTPAANANGGATITLTLSDDGGTANGGDDTSVPVTFTITVNAVNDPPTVTPPAAYSAHAHIGISIPNGASDLLDGSTITDVDGVDAAPFNLTAGGFTSTNGGTGTVNADGSFSYDPPAGFTGSDTFTYQICDSGVPAPGACTDAIASVTVSGPRVWFVDNTASAGDGRLSAPFNTLAAADAAADANGDRIFVYTGTSTHPGGFTLQNSQRLVGQGVIDTDFDTALDITPPGTSAARPTINGSRPAISGTIVLAPDVVARGFNINNTTATGIAGNAATGLTINQVSVTTTTGTAVNLVNSGGTANFTSLSANGATSGVVLNGTTGSFTVTGDGSTAGSGGTIQNTTGDAVSLTNASNVELNFVNITNSDANGVFGNNVTGFTLNGANVTANGDAVNEGGLRFDNLLGAATILDTTISGSAEHNIEITNTTGVLSSLTILGSTIGTNSAALGSDGLLLETRNSAQANVVVNGSTFNDNQSDGIQVSAINDSSAMLTVNDSMFTSTLDLSPAGSTGARGIVLSASTNASLEFDIGSTTSNVFENFSPGIGEEAINVTLLSTSTASGLMSGRINNNTFINSGGAIGIDLRGNGALVMEIDGNTANTSRQAIDVITGDAVGDAATIDLTITNNSLTVAGTGANPNNEAIGWLGDRDTVSCLNVRGNIGVASGTRPDFLIDDFTTAGGSVDIESGPADCGGSCGTSQAHLLANNTITDATSGAGLVPLGTCVTVP